MSLEDRRDRLAMDGSLNTQNATTGWLAENVDGHGGAISGKPVWSRDEIVTNLARLDAAWSWDNNLNSNHITSRSGIDHEVTFGFQNMPSMLRPTYRYPLPDLSPELVDFRAFSPAQIVATRQSVRLWDDVAAISFREERPEVADIDLGNRGTPILQQAYALPPSKGYLAPQVAAHGEAALLKAGDVWVDATKPSNLDLRYGGYGKTTLIHELGHSLGLPHTGDYNAGVGQNPTYEKDASYYQDTSQYSIMSYFDAELSGARTIDWNLLEKVTPNTPMIHDIAAIQAIYGADMTTRAGDTVYGFNNTSGNPVFDFAMNQRPVVAIWDGGGNDTLDFSGWSAPSTINLNPGGFSSGGGLLTDHIPTLFEVNQQRTMAGLPLSTLPAYNNFIAAYHQYFTDGLMRDNISIAYGATIENAVGGRGNDLIIANSAANNIAGNAGNDMVSYREATEAVQASLSTNSGTGGAQGDHYVDIEAIEGSAFNDTLSANPNGAGLYGLAGNDSLEGGARGDTLDGGAGNDVLKGLLGDDWLRGGEGDDQLDGGAGRDSLQGGAGRDIFLFSDPIERDSIEDFRSAEDVIDLSRLDAKAGEGIDHFNWIGTGGFSGQAGELRMASHGTDHFLEGDVTGDGIGDFVLMTTMPVERTDLVLG